jgi:hypothetical protein
MAEILVLSLYCLELSLTPPLQTKSIYFVPNFAEQSSYSHDLWSQKLPASYHSPHPSSLFGLYFPNISSTCLLPPIAIFLTTAKSTFILSPGPLPKLSHWVIASPLS